MLPQSNNLYHIEAQYLELLRQVEEAEGEITPEIDQALQFTERQMQEAAINIGYVIKSIEDKQNIIAAEAKRLTGLMLKLIKAEELLKNRLKESMQRFGIEKVSSPTLTVSFRKSNAVEIENEALIPAAYFDSKPPTVSKTRIKEAIKAGTDVPGATLVEHKNLQIK